MEVQLTLNSAKYVSANDANDPASIAGKCTLMYHQVEMIPDNILRYSDLRGNYSIVNRRFTELTNGYQTYTAVQAAATGSRATEMPKQLPRPGTDRKLSG